MIDLLMILSVSFYPYHFDRTILSIPFCPIEPLEAMTGPYSQSRGLVDRRGKEHLPLVSFRIISLSCNNEWIINDSFIFIHIFKTISKHFDFSRFAFLLLAPSLVPHTNKLKNFVQHYRHIIPWPIVWSKKNKFKLETKTPSWFVRPVNSITKAKFQLPTPTGRLCSMTLKYCHVLLLDANLDAVNICRGDDSDSVSFCVIRLINFPKGI